MLNVPNRRDWRAIEVSPDEEVLVQTMQAFGWKLHRHVMSVGSKLVTQSKTQISRSQAPNLTLYVRGRAKFFHADGRIFEDRVPGLYSGDRPDTPAGKMIHEVLEELEFWCFNWHANRGALPQVQVFRLADGQPFLGNNSQKVITCFGVLGDKAPGTAFVYDGAPLLARGQVYGFLIGASRD